MALLAQLPFATIRMREWTCSDLFLPDQENNETWLLLSSPQALERAYNQTVIGRGEPYA